MGGARVSHACPGVAGSRGNGAPIRVADRSAGVPRVSFFVVVLRIKTRRLGGHQYGGRRVLGEGGKKKDEQCSECGKLGRIRPLGVAS